MGESDSRVYGTGKTRRIHTASNAILQTFEFWRGAADSQ